jgi:RNA polymerase subunit RPABC4/transcription elongation factor Spt4
MTDETITLYCENHPNRETSLRCNRCDKPICSNCAVLTPTGYRCTECVSTQQKSFDTAEWFDYIIAIAIGVILAFIGSSLASRIGFFTIFVAPFAGMLIAEAIRLAVRRRRSKRLFQLSAAATAFGGLLPVIMGVAAGFLVLFPYLWPVVFTLLVTSTVYYRLAGIRLSV